MPKQTSMVFKERKQNKDTQQHNIKMSNKYPKISRHSNVKENVTHDQEKYHSVFLKVSFFLFGITRVNFY